jgi:CubicO group peptidase (beta-lactamase class C family)
LFLPRKGTSSLALAAPVINPRGVIVKKVCLAFLVLLMLSVSTFAEIESGRDISGIWKGVIDTPTEDIALYWRIQHLENDSILAVNDCPVYGVKDVPAPVSWLREDSLYMEVQRFPASYFGLLSENPDSIYGYYKGEGSWIPLNIKRISNEPAELLPYMVPRLGDDKQRELNWTYEVPEAQENDWPTSHLSTAGLDPDLIQQMVENVLLGLYPNVHSVLIARHGNLVLDEYFYGYTANTPHPIYSNCKGIITASLGIAIEEGLLPGIDTRMIDLFPEHAEQFDDSLKREITLEHFLTMTAGYQWDEASTSYYDPGNTNRQMMDSDNFVKFVLAQPLANPPGVEHTYNSGIPHVLSEVVRRASGMDFWVYAEANIFKPLNFSHYFLGTNKHGEAGGALIRPRDFLKLAQLYQDQGKWKGEQILAPGWLGRSYLQDWDPEKPSYWNHWGGHTLFVDGIPVTKFSGGGFGGQSLYSFPDLDLEVVFTAGNFTTQGPDYDEIMSKYILPPLVNDGYLPPNHSGNSGYTEMIGYEWNQTAFTRLGSLWSALEFLGENVTEAWVYGMSGTAFALNANPQMWSSCLGRWENPKLKEHLDLLGYTYSTTAVYYLHPQFDEVRETAWNEVRGCVDNGYPAWGFHMNIPENYILYAYDDYGYYFKGRDCPGGFGPKPWNKVADEDPGWFEIHTLKPTEAAHVKHAVLVALEYAVEMYRNPDQFPHDGFVFGPQAYDQWQQTLASGEADWFGVAYCVRGWSTCRANASDFLIQIEDLVPEACRADLRIAQSHYAVVAQKWMAVNSLFPYQNTERWERTANWKSEQSRSEAATLLAEAAEAEALGVAALETVIALAQRSR